MKLSPNEIVELNLYKQNILKLHAWLKAHKQFPAPDQWPPLLAFFRDDCMVVQEQCGRDSGKTERILYVSHRYAITHPNSLILIVCPEKDQGKKIYWATRRMQNYGPAEFIAPGGIRKSELTKTFVNGSTIMVVGCENYEALRGVKPQLVFYDEFQLHSKEFDEEVMQPNLSRGDTKLYVAGTPPKVDCYYVEFRDDLLHEIENGNKKYTYVEMPTWVNPLSDREWLERKKQQLIRRGRYNTWLREYEGKLVFDAEGAILPTWEPDRHVVSDSFIRNKIEKIKHKLNWYAIFDPGTGSCFAVLFIAVNRYTGEVFFIDEIYETERRLCSAIRIWKRAKKIKEDWFDRSDRWNNIYDEAAAWFIQEVISYHKQTLTEGLRPTHKAFYKDKENVNPDDGRPGEGVLMDLMVAGNPQLFFVNEKCKKFKWEIEQYVKIKNKVGRYIYPSKNDHLMDCMFYWVLETCYSLAEDVDDELEYEKWERENVRADSVEDYIYRKRVENNYAAALESGQDFYDYDDYTEDILGWN